MLSITRRAFLKLSGATSLAGLAIATPGIVLSASVRQDSKASFAANAETTRQGSRAPRFVIGVIKEGKLIHASYQQLCQYII